MFRRIRKLFKPVKVPEEAELIIISEPRRTYTVSSNQTLLSALRAHGEEVSSYCGGMCSCGTCIVKIIDSTNLQPPTSREKAVLGFSGEQNNERLSCQVRITGDLKIRLLQRY